MVTLHICSPIQALGETVLASKIDQDFIFCLVCICSLKYAIVPKNHWKHNPLFRRLTQGAVRLVWVLRFVNNSDPFLFPLPSLPPSWGEARLESHPRQLPSPSPPHPPRSLPSTDQRSEVRGRAARGGRGGIAVPVMRTAQSSAGVEAQPSSKHGSDMLSPGNSQIQAPKVLVACRLFKVFKCRRRVLQQCSSVK